QSQGLTLPSQPKAAPAPALPPAQVPPALPLASPEAPGDDEETQEPDDAARLAEKMSLNAWERCAHGRPNRCPTCGVERVWDADPGPDGAPVWVVRWRPISGG